jgi:hypothetical protein
VGWFLVQKDIEIIQGDPLAPILFAIYIDEMLMESDITKVLIIVFDDIRILYNE